MIRKSVLINHGIRYLNYYYAEDYEIWNQLAEVTQLVNLPEVLLVYRLHSQQVSNVHELVQEQHAEIIRKNQLRQLDIEPSVEDYQTHLDFCHFRIRVHEPDQY